MLVFCITIFSFASFVFSKSIFVMKISNVIILYYFYANYALFLSMFVQLFSSLNFLVFSLFVVYITIFLFGSVYVMQSLVVVMLFSMKQVLILYKIFLRTCLFIFSTKALLLSLTTILLFLLQKEEYVFILVAITIQISDLRDTIIIIYYFFRIVSLSFMPFYYLDCFFVRNSMLLGFCHICTGIGP